MEGLSGINEVAEVEQSGSDREISFDEKILDKYDKILGDDIIEAKNGWDENSSGPLSSAEREQKFNKLFDFGDMFKGINKMTTMSSESNIDDGSVNRDVEESSDENEKNLEDNAIDENEEIDSEVDDVPQFEKGRESAEKRKQQVEKVKIELFGEKGANLEYELDGNKYETDDNGVTYKKNGELLSNVEYSENGHVYQTDFNGRIKSCDGKPQYNDEGNRNIKEQKESGGEERQEDDDGGHVIAKILNGPEGSENLVPMRRTINRGDYKKMENEIAKAIQEGKKVTMHVDIEYDGDSQRPSKIRVEYTIDGKKTIVEFDNKENSTELLDSLEGMISDEDYQDLKNEIEDMKDDGVETSVTSVKTEYDENGNSTKITVGILDESTGKKTYKVYEPRRGA